MPITPPLINLKKKERWPMNFKMASACPRNVFIKDSESAIRRSTGISIFYPYDYPDIGIFDSYNGTLVIKETEFKTKKGDIIHIACNSTDDYDKIINGIKNYIGFIKKNPQLRLLHFRTTACRFLFKEIDMKNFHHNGGLSETPEFIVFTLYESQNKNDAYDKIIKVVCNRKKERDKLNRLK